MNKIHKITFASVLLLGLSAPASFAESQIDTLVDNQNSECLKAKGILEDEISHSPERLSNDPIINYSVLTAASLTTGFCSAMLLRGGGFDLKFVPAATSIIALAFGLYTDMMQSSNGLSNHLRRLQIEKLSC